MNSKNHGKNRIISSNYGKGQDYNDYVDGFTDEEGPDIRKNDDSNEYKYTMRMFPNPDW